MIRRDGIRCDARGQKPASRAAPPATAALPSASRAGSVSSSKSSAR